MTASSVPAAFSSKRRWSSSGVHLVLCLLISPSPSAPALRERGGCPTSSPVISPSPWPADLLAKAPLGPSSLRRSFDRKSRSLDPELVVRSNLSVGGC